MPLEQVEASVRCVDGAVPLAHLSASFGGPHGPGRLETSVRDFAVPPSAADDNVAPPEPEDFVREADLKVEHLVVGSGLLGELPDPAPEIDNDFRPAGPVSVSCALRRDGPHGWHKDWVIRPEGIRGKFHKFAYELNGVAGTIEMTTRSDHNTDATVRLAGYTAGRPVTIKGGDPRAENVLRHRL